MKQQSKKIYLVGKAKEDVKIIILDENKNELEDGKVGEILIVGESVASGYLGEEKEESFIKYNGEKAYLTGDLGYIENGKLYYIDRKDNQIKYKGYRIEIADIEENIYKLNYIDKVKVIVKKNDENKVNKLVAFIKLKSNVRKKEEEIRKELTLKVPDYMIPIIKIIQEFPINDNGKIDTEKLRRNTNGG